MVAAHFLIPRATLVAFTALVLITGCSRDTGPEESPQDDSLITREGVNVEFTVQPIRGGVGDDMPVGHKVTVCIYDDRGGDVGADAETGPRGRVGAALDESLRVDVDDGRRAAVDRVRSTCSRTTTTPTATR